MISIWNNGKGIPVEMHREEKVYVPAMIFGQLLTSSNYDDDEKKVTGGRNGYGAKLCNIFSSEFTIETACKESGRMFKQVRSLLKNRKCIVMFVHWSLKFTYLVTIECTFTQNADFIWFINWYYKIDLNFKTFIKPGTREGRARLVS